MKTSSDSPLRVTRLMSASGLLVLLALLAWACGPQTVPFPSGPRPSSAGQYSQPWAGTAALPSADAGKAGGDGLAGRDGGAASAANGGAPGSAGAGASAPGTTMNAGSESPLSYGVPFDAGSDPDRNNALPGGLCARLATIQCAAEAHCCLSPTRGVEGCETEVRNVCAQELFLDQIAANPVTGFDAAATASALTELEARSARCDLGIAAWSLSSAGIRGILKGTFEPGESCKPPGTSAVTEKPAQAAALASCKFSDDYACLPKSLLGDWTCAAKSGVDENCVTDDNCQPDMYCRNPNMAPLGKCAQRLAIGQTCVNGNECSSLYCKAGSCVPVDQQVAFCLE